MRLANYGRNFSVLGVLLHYDALKIQLYFEDYDYSITFFLILNWLQ